MTQGDGNVIAHPQLQTPRAILFMTVVSSAAALGVFAAHQPLLAGAAVLLAPLGLAVLILPDLSTLTVVAILYSNAAVLAVQFHGVPFMVGASVPVLLVVPLATYLIFHREEPILAPALPWLLLFLVVQLVGTLFSANIATSSGPLLTFAIEGVGLYFLITNSIRRFETLRRAVWVLLLVGAGLGALSLYQQVTQSYGNNYWGFAQMSNAAFGTGVGSLEGEVMQRRLAGPIGDDNFYAQIMLMLVPLGLFRFWGERKGVLRVLALGTTTLIGVGVALTFSRGAAVGFVLMLALMTFMRYIRPYQLVTILLGLAVLLWVVPQFGVRLIKLEALSSVASPEGGAPLEAADPSIQSRATEMLSAALVFADHPLIGVGTGMYHYYYQDYAQIIGIRPKTTDRQAHSLYLDLAAETGALGLFCFLGILYVTLRGLARTRWRFVHVRPEFSDMATGFILAIATYLATAFFLNLGYERYFWLMVALASAMHSIAIAPTPAESEPSRGLVR